MRRPPRRVFLILFVAITLLRPSLGVLAQAEGPVYIVEPGDTLTAIALKFGTTVEALVAANGIQDPSILIPGMELVIPGYEGVSGVLVTHEVEFGETLASLGLRYGVSTDVLTRLNRLVNPARIYVGQQLVMPETGEARHLDQARYVLPEAKESLLELSVRQNADPWVLRAYNGTSNRMWWLPGSPLVVPGGERPLIGLPEPIQGVRVRPVPTTQGDTAVVEVELRSPAWVEGQLGSQRLNFNAVDDLDLVALQGIYALAEPGLVDLDLRFFTSQAGERTFELVQPIRVVEGDYAYEELVVPPETINPDNTLPEDELIASIVSQVTPDRLWDGVFQFPSSYSERFASLFGTRRSYNRSGFTYYHTGLDLYGSTTTPVLAPARGRVAFTGSLTVRGNATYIDHGWGVYSGILHQSQILVSEGDMVEPGQTIGYVGGTGRVTGTHLHWEIWVGGVPVQPLDWTADAFP